MNRKKYWMFPLVGIALIALGSLVVMMLWNWIIPDIIPAVKEITYLQSLGLLVLCRILFGHFGRRGGGHWNKSGPNQWGGQWKQKWSQMTDEEKEKYKEEWRKRCGKY